MDDLNFTDFASKDRFLRAIRRESEALLALASDPGAWEAPTASGHWQVRDIVGHLVDTTEDHLAAFAAARGAGEGTAAPPQPPRPQGVDQMDRHVDERALAFRGTPRDELLDRLDCVRSEALDLYGGLTAEEWGGLIVPHRFMGPLPACFYPAAELVDHAVHAWDVRQGTGRGHALDGEAADLLVPVCLALWQATARCDGPEPFEPFELGVRVSGPNGGETRISVSAGGLGVERAASTPGGLGDLPLVLEFDPSSLVLTAMGRIAGGTARGDARLADRFLNLFVRI